MYIIYNIFANGTAALSNRSAQRSQLNLVTPKYHPNHVTLVKMKSTALYGIGKGKKAGSSSNKLR